MYQQSCIRLRGSLPGWPARAALAPWLSLSFVGPAVASDPVGGFGSQVEGTACYADLVAGLPGVYDGETAWGDYDNDGDLDIVLTGRANAQSISRVYRNSGGPNPTFGDIAAGLTGVHQSCVAWADLNDDGYLDIILAGGSSEGVVTKIYMNSGGANPVFTDLLAPLPGVFEGTVAPGDYDNDGDLDFALTGSMGPSGYIARIYRNNGGAHPTFTDIGAGLPGVRNSATAWGDYDNDGDLDLALTGLSDTEYIARIYRNSGGAAATFEHVFEVGGGASGSVAWGDYDNDGDLDLACTGGLGSSAGAQLYINTGGVEPTLDFTLVGLTGAQKGTIAWGDYNNDGFLDVLVVGWNGLAPSSKVFESSGGEFPTFTDIGAGLPGVGRDAPVLVGASAAWGDCDNDGRLDVLLSGTMVDGSLITRIYRNTCGTTNTPPTAPTNLQMTTSGTRATFAWNAATDAQTPTSGLSYNLRVGTAPGLADIVGPMADLATGSRRVVALGNTNSRTSWEIELMGSTPIYWSVQAVDGAFAGSPFTTSTPVDAPNSEALAYALVSAGPNPFSRATTIQFSQPRDGQVSVAVYDVAGHRVRTLVDGSLRSGTFTKAWDGRDDAGRILGSGVYFIRMRTADFERSHRIVLAR